MGKKGGSAPAAPDPYATAQAQSQANQETALWNMYLNQINQYTPYGSIEYSQIPGSGGNGLPPQFQSKINFTPEGQALFNQKMQQDLALGNLAGGYLGQIEGVMKSDPLQADDAARQRIEQALMDRLAPYQEKDRERMRTQLANQGITMGSEAYNNEQDTFNRSVNDARLATISQAGDEMARMFSLQQAARQQPLNEFNALRSASQLQSPTTGLTGMASGGAQPGDIQGAVYNSYQAQLDAWKQKQAGNNAFMGGLFNLGSAAIANPAVFTSDVRLKKDICYIDTVEGIDVYSFRYKGKKKRHIGVMAQDIMYSIADAVKNINGYLAVDYSKLPAAVRGV